MDRCPIHDHIVGALKHSVGLESDANNGIGTELPCLLLSLLDQLLPQLGSHLGQVLDLTTDDALEACANVLEDVPRADLLSWTLCVSCYVTVL